MTDEKTVPPGSMFSLGWLMARLFDLAQPPQDTQATSPKDTTRESHLLATSELGAADYVEVAFAELDELLPLVPGQPSDDDVKSAWKPPDLGMFASKLAALHLMVLRGLAADHQQLSAYQLGRAIYDTCLRPGQLSPGDDDQPVAGSPSGALVLGEFDRARLATLQTWLAEASDVLPKQSASTVSRSLQNWQDWADVNAASVRGDGWAAAKAPVLQALRTQGSVWHALLSGETELDGQLSAAAWIEAGESIARTTGRLTRMVLRRFWPVLLVLAVITGGLLFLAIDQSTGTAKVWTSLVTVAAALGVTGASLRAATLRAADGLEAGIERTATLDAYAWSATWLPALEPDTARRRELARRGVAAPQLKLALEPAS